MLQRPVALSYLTALYFKWTDFHGYLLSRSPSSESLYVKPHQPVLALYQNILYGSLKYLNSVSQFLLLIKDLIVIDISDRCLKLALFSALII